MDFLFGGDSPGPALLLTFLVLAAGLILLFWLFRRLAGSQTGTFGRQRRARLSISEVAAVDTKRRLVLVRRDNVEHLVMIGGQSDFLIESHIRRPVAREPEFTEDAAPSRRIREKADPLLRRTDIPAATAPAAAAIVATRPEAEPDIIDTGRDAPDSESEDFAPGGDFHIELDELSPAAEEEDDFLARGLREELDSLGLPDFEEERSPVMPEPEPDESGTISVDSSEPSLESELTAELAKSGYVEPFALPHSGRNRDRRRLEQELKVEADMQKLLDELANR